MMYEIHHPPPLPSPGKSMMVEGASYYRYLKEQLGIKFYGKWIASCSIL